MVHGLHATCNSCSKLYRIRYTVGSSFPQHASFACLKCGEIIKYGYTSKQEKILDNATQFENKQITENGAVIINLHPEITISKEDIHKEHFFPSIPFLMAQAIEDRKLAKLREMQHSILSFHDTWSEVAVDFRLMIEGKTSLIAEKKSKSDAEAVNEVYKMIIECCEHFIRGKWESIQNNVDNELKLISAKKASRAFFDYLNNDRFDELLRKGYQCMKEYSEKKAELSVTLLSQKLGIEEIKDNFSSTISWEDIEMVYGNLYEIYATFLLIPTGINNIKLRGGFQNFITPGFTIEKYLNTDKANRCNNFSGNLNLRALGDCYVATYRNATHHKSSKLDKSNQMIEMVTGKNNTTVTLISYITYLEHCNDLFARILVLLNSLLKIKKGYLKK